jgi:asparagine synthase (glutamine-hydrolysing)
MCGFAGFLDLTRSTAEPEATARAMAATLVHRGPDDAGTWVDTAVGIALGFRRLAIVDLSPQGHQPMVSHDGRWVIVFNGEIYNHAALRARLGPAIAWHGHSDTEVLLEAVSTWGIDRAIDSFDGMFAFALWDRAERTLTLGRDRFGEKPLYWGRVGGRLLFASELKAFRPHPAWDDSIDREALGQMLRLGWIPAPATIHTHARKLEPGTLVSITAEGRVDTRRYWSAETQAAAVAGSFTGDRIEAAARIETLLTQSVRLRMQADVPVGLFLSGGVDSALIAALMTREAAGPVHSFTIGFDQAGLDESAHAAALARHLGTTHTEIRMTEAQALDLVPALPVAFDEPFADPAALPTLLLARGTRRRVTVALSGDGADELFGGYGIYRSLPADWRRLSCLPVGLRRAAALGARLLSGPAERMAASVRWGRRRSHPGFRMNRSAEHLTAGSLPELMGLHYSRWRGMPLPVARVQGRAPLFSGPGPMVADPALAVMLLDCRGYLADDLCVKTDRATMAASLEARLPFLDPALAAFAWSLPAGHKIEGTIGKAVLRDLLYRLVPRPLVDRPKMGFEVPIGRWLRGSLRPWADDLLSPSRLSRQGWLDGKLVARCWREHRDGAKNWQTELWHVLMFQAWLDRG